MKKRKLCYICSPLRDDVSGNVTRANLYSRFAFERGYLPIAPHAIFTQYLDDSNASERAAAMDMGLELLAMCEELWVFGPRVSNGMKREIESARNAKISTRYFTADMEEE